MEIVGLLSPFGATTSLDAARLPVRSRITTQLAPVGQIHPQPAPRAGGVASRRERRRGLAVQTGLLEHLFVSHGRKVIRAVGASPVCELPAERAAVSLAMLPGVRGEPAGQPDSQAPAAQRRAAALPRELLGGTLPLWLPTPGPARRRKKSRKRRLPSERWRLSGRQPSGRRRRSPPASRTELVVSDLCL